MKAFITELREERALVLDTETTGLDNSAEILQIGIVSLEGETLFNSLIKPARARRWPEAQRVHGIAPADVMDAPTMAEVAEPLQEIMHGRLVAIYNAKFDSRMLWQSIKAHQTGDSFAWMQGQKWACVMEAYAAYWGRPGRYGSFQWQSLANACRQQGVRVVAAHDALADARLTAALIRAVEGKLRR